MRSDLGKVVMERPRAGLRLKQPKGYRKRQASVANEDQPRSEKIKQKWQLHYDDKRFTDLLGPLYHYLLKQVGRRWDAVWSDICHNLPQTNFPLMHIRGHVLQYVEVHVNMIDGKPYHKTSKMYYSYDRKGPRPVEPYSNHVWAMYVHPDTGILCKVGKTAKPKRKQEKPYRLTDNELVRMYLISGIWYEITFQEVPVPPTCTNRMRRIKDPNVIYGIRYIHYECKACYPPRYHCLLLGDLWSANELKYKHGRAMYAVGKRQLNTKEIKELRHENP